MEKRRDRCEYENYGSRPEYRNLLGSVVTGGLKIEVGPVRTKI